VFVILREAGLSVRIQARGIFPLRGVETEGRVVDLVAADPQVGPWLLVVVTVADPLQASVTALAVESGHAARVQRPSRRPSTPTLAPRHPHPGCDRDFLLHRWPV
jgi:hypothetical protein